MRRAAVLAAALVALLALPSATGLHARPTVGHRIQGRGTPCSVFTDSNACQASGCSFCQAASDRNAAPVCVTGAGSTYLPPEHFTCATSPAAAKAAAAHKQQRRQQQQSQRNDPCEGKAQAACDALDECTWCKSAAVPSSCYTRAQAKFLPSAVFTCDKASPTRVVSAVDRAKARASRRRAAGQRAAERATD